MFGTCFSSLKFKWKEDREGFLEKAKNEGLIFNVQKNSMASNNLPYILAKNFSTFLSASVNYLHFNLETVLKSMKMSNMTAVTPMNIANCGETNRLHIDRQIDKTLTPDYHCIIRCYFLASQRQYTSKAIHKYAIFPRHGITDNVVKIKDNVQIFDDLSKIIFLIVGRILLEKNSPI